MGDLQLPGPGPGPVGGGCPVRREPAAGGLARALQLRALPSAVSAAGVGSVSVPILQARTPKSGGHRWQ